MRRLHRQDRSNDSIGKLILVSDMSDSLSVFFCEFILILAFTSAAVATHYKYICLGFSLYKIIKLINNFLININIA
jgi:hypothetical protein